MNDFTECLAYSHTADELPIWKEIYQKAFPNMIGMHSYRKDGYWQRLGVDRGIFLSDSKVIYVDEKVRRPNKYGKPYTDIALEYISNDRKKEPGWVCKPLRCEYIAYLVPQLGVCYLMPVLQLQTAWQLNKDNWTDPKQFGQISAPNKGYNTISATIPPKILFFEILCQLKINFNPFNAQ